VSTVVGVDPGGTTGLALWSPDMGLSLRQIEGADVAVDWMADCARTLQCATFVVEKYIITPATAKLSQQHDPLEIIGALKFLTRKYKHKLVLQSPSEAKAFSTNDKLKRVGWYQPGQDHARDASRHVLLYLSKVGIIDLHTLIGGVNADL
jgi:hypothetical protein